MSSDCDLVTTLTDDDLWGFLEGTCSDEKTNSIRTHSVGCWSCLDHMGRQLQHLETLDPKRWNLYHQENLAVRRATLLRAARKAGKEIDVSKIVSIEDYYKSMIYIALGDYGDYFLQLWEVSDQETREGMIVNFAKILVKLNDKE